MNAKNITVDGQARYTDDAEYVVCCIDGKHAVRRGDGDHTTCETESEANEVADSLICGETRDCDYDWTR